MTDARNRARNRVLAEYDGWECVLELDGHLFGAPPGQTGLIVPVPDYFVEGAEIRGLIGRIKGEPVDFFASALMEVVGADFDSKWVIGTAVHRIVTATPAQLAEAAYSFIVELEELS
jgi:hypothetical protein